MKATLILAVTSLLSGMLLAGEAKVTQEAMVTQQPKVTQLLSGTSAGACCGPDRGEELPFQAAEEAFNPLWCRRGRPE